MVGADPHGEAGAVGEPQDRALMPVPLDGGDAGVDRDWMPELGPAANPFTQQGQLAGGRAVTELPPAHRRLLTSAAHLELGDHVRVVRVSLQEAGDDNSTVDHWGQQWPHRGNVHAEGIPGSGRVDIDSRRDGADLPQIVGQDQVQLIGRCHVGAVLID
ncbi:hypothetical protein AB0C40_32140 [Streptomyces brevispora]|uniref:hypothetical protein n=1 Tax=Streptomyces brevispora TaxID=887462 RepID=UPI003400E9CF